MDIESEVHKIEKQIASLKYKRDRLIRDSGIGHKRLQTILAMRSPQKTICQLLRELHDALNGNEKTKVEQCLLIAKKMNDKLIECAGKQYSRNWYDSNGNFK